MFEVGQKVKCKSAVWDPGTISPTPEAYAQGVIRHIHPSGRFATVEVGKAPHTYLESFMLSDLKELEE